MRPDDQREGKLAEQAWDLREYDLRHSADPRDWVILRHPNSQEAVDAGYWNDFAVLEQELLAFIAAHGEPGVMPKKTALEAAGRGDLANAISRAGGHYAAAQRLGLRPADSRRAQNHWADFANLERELRAFVKEPSRPQRMPTLAELIAAGRFDLHYAVQRNGGVRAVAERLGWRTASAQRSPDPESGSGSRRGAGVKPQAT